MIIIMIIIIIMNRINNDKNVKDKDANDNNMIQKYKQQTRTKQNLISRKILLAKDYKNKKY
jgi:hypothetical protein